MGRSAGRLEGQRGETDRWESGGVVEIPHTRSHRRGLPVILVVVEGLVAGVNVAGGYRRARKDRKERYDNT